MSKASIYLRSEPIFSTLSNPRFLELCLISIKLSLSIPFCTNTQQGKKFKNMYKVLSLHKTPHEAKIVFLRS